jgi:hypothetical protein
MGHHSNLQNILRLSIWPLLLCGVDGCALARLPFKSSPPPAERRVIANNPTYGFRQTCWHPWPECYGAGPEQGCNAPAPQRPADREAVPAPQGQPNATMQSPIMRLPEIPMEDLQPPHGSPQNSYDP